jgi:hypothetical protein
MSINLIRFLASQKKRAERYHTDALRYRGVVYKDADTSSRHDGGIDHKKFFKRLKLVYKFYP